MSTKNIEHILNDALKENLSDLHQYSKIVDIMNFEQSVEEYSLYYNRKIITSNVTYSTHLRKIQKILNRNISESRCGIHCSNARNLFTNYTRRIYV